MANGGPWYKKLKFFKTLRHTCKSLILYMVHLRTQYNTNFKLSLGSLLVSQSGQSLVDDPSFIALLFLTVPGLKLEC